MPWPARLWTGCQVCNAGRNRPFIFVSASSALTLQKGSPRIRCITNLPDQPTTEKERSIRTEQGRMLKGEEATYNAQADSRMVRDVTGHEPFLPRELAPEQVISCIGLISDTHMPERCRELPASVRTIFSSVDLVLHAGDVGELSVLDHLGELAPVVAVHGNDESANAARVLPYQQVIARAGQRIVLCHTHFPDPAEERAWRRRHPTRGDWVTRCAALGHTAGSGIVVHGHTHGCKADLPRSRSTGCQRYSGVMRNRHPNGCAAYP
jgi:putative phosphoesterase